jgi:hypothetical protein
MVNITKPSLTGVAVLAMPGLLGHQYWNDKPLMENINIPRESIYKALYKYDLLLVEKKRSAL